MPAYLKCGKLPKQLADLLRLSLMSYFNTTPDSNGIMTDISDVSMPDGWQITFTDILAKLGFKNVNIVELFCKARQKAGPVTAHIDGSFFLRFLKHVEDLCHVCEQPIKDDQKRIEKLVRHPSDDNSVPGNRTQIVHQKCDNLKTMSWYTMFIYFGPSSDVEFKKESKYPCLMFGPPAKLGKDARLICNKLRHLVELAHGEFVVFCGNVPHESADGPRDRLTFEVRFCAPKDPGEGCTRQKRKGAKPASAAARSRKKNRK